ncbi:hypothetical protein AMS68_002485 [Peltaster fructicola]|uniref:Mannosyltransferase n=1 Tax=Peltaster fructicola TaxID=286661 RepID=A0A6H0XQQ0_9PEZI|nr:hypothetical protein AMS68_002485 [Peltaster fructicola]
MSESALPIAVLLVVIRSANAYLSSTFFQPDEFFQALEPAWQLAFGSGSGAWITWEWREQLRSAIHPVLFAGTYKAADTVAGWLSLSLAARAEVLLAAPKLIQVPIAAAIDFYTWRLSLVCTGDARVSWAALLLSIWSPWQWYVSTRTFSNTLEAMLTVLALAWWPWQWTVGGSEKTPATKASLTAALAAAAFACVLRPTNAIIWIAILATSAYRYGIHKKASDLAGQALLAGSAVLVLSVSIDRAFYNSWTIPQLQFLYMNVGQSISTFYGRNRTDYYFTEGIPLLLTTALPFGAIGFWKALRPGVDRPDLAGYQRRQTQFVLAMAVVVTVLTFSSISHKEVRFIYPILPILHVFAAQPIASFFKLFPIEKHKFRVALLSLVLTINLYIMAYTSLIHQRGVMDVTHFLRHEAETAGGIRNITVGFLMPCHSTPWRSHFVHPRINAWAFTCEPPLGVPVQWRDEYQDEADVFYNYPAGWIDRYLDDRSIILKHEPKSNTASQEQRRPWPDYLIYFEHLEPVMNAVLDSTRYEEHVRFFNTHWHDDNRRRGDVIVQKLNPRS